MNPLTTKARENLIRENLIRENLIRENLIISCCCGVVFAALTIAFFL